MPSKEAEQMLIGETENLSNCSGLDSLTHNKSPSPTPTSPPPPPLPPLFLTSQSQSLPSSVQPPTSKSLILKSSLQKSETLSVKMRNFKNLNTTFTEDDFLNGISFEAKVYASYSIKIIKAILFYLLYILVYWFIRCCKAK